MRVVPLALKSRLARWIERKRDRASGDGATGTTTLYGWLRCAVMRCAAPLCGRIRRRLGPDVGAAVEMNASALFGCTLARVERSPFPGAAAAFIQLGRMNGSAKRAQCRAQFRQILRAPSGADGQRRRGRNRLDWLARWLAELRNKRLVGGLPGRTLSTNSIELNLVPF